MKTRVIEIDPRKIHLLEINARYMRHETFARLTENIKDDDALTQIPFGWHMHDDQTKQPLFEETGDPKWEVLSGNHRVKTSIAAGLSTIPFQVTDEYLTQDKRRAIQLSHNQISGEDDPAVLREIYMSIADPTMRLYTGFDDKQLKLLDEVETGSLSEANLTFQTISMVFLPDELTAINKAWELAKTEIRGSKGAWLASMRDYDKAMDAFEAASSSYGIKNTATCLMLVLEVFSRHIGDLAEGWFNDQTGEAIKGSAHVPLSTAIGTEQIPASAAATIKRAVDLMVKRGDADKSKRWQALEAMAKTYLSESEQIGAEHAKAK